MELNQRIKELRQEKKISREDLFQRLQQIFGDEAIKPNTIWRIESGLTAARTSSLHQLCLGLGVSLRDLLISIEPEFKMADLIKKDKRIDQYVYGPKARAEIISSPRRSFAVQELTLLPGGVTQTEEDPTEVGKFEKLVYCITGSITCVVGTEKNILNKGDSLSFESNIPHHFENNSSRKARCIIVQNPRHI